MQNWHLSTSCFLTGQESSHHEGRIIISVFGVAVCTEIGTSRYTLGLYHSRCDYIGSSDAGNKVPNRLLATSQTFFCKIGKSIYFWDAATQVWTNGYLPELLSCSEKFRETAKHSKRGWSKHWLMNTNSIYQFLVSGQGLFCIHLLNMCLLNCYCMPGLDQGARSKTINKTDKIT